MKIGITLNEVIRDFIGQLKYTYSKYYSEDLTDVEIDDFNLINFFKFKNRKKLNEFLYSESPMEIFAHADQLHNNLGAILNKFIVGINDYEEHEIIIISKEVHKSIPSTLFFLSKLGFIGNNIKFVIDEEKMWNYVDILISANPIALKVKPSDKISVKINASYNLDIESDFEFDSILDIIDNNENLKKITKNG